MTSRLSMKGKVALITGSSQGIGLATARALAQRGASVMLNARHEDTLTQACAALWKEGHTAHAMAADVSVAAQAQALVASTLEKFGRLDVLINNAGVSMRSEFEELNAAACEKMVAVNLLGSVYPTLHAVAPIRQSGGSIVFISSIAGLVGLPTGSLYCATKTALRGLADSLRCELGPHGVHVGMVYVGFTQNDPAKTVVGVKGGTSAPNRPAHMTQAQVGNAVTHLAQTRQRQVVLTPIGKLARLAAWLSPEMVEKTIILSRQYQLAERMGFR